ncbi:MAG: hypothetical protein JNL57_04585, partial [Bacteroidetes bacterium]|nr:hypothetical protein [Bacteroidota bacterium]
MDFNNSAPIFKTSAIPCGNDGQFVLTDLDGKLKLVALSRNYIYNSSERVMKGSGKTYAEPYSLVDGFPYPGSKDSVVICHDFYDTSLLKSGKCPFSFGYSIVNLAKDSGRGEVVKNFVRIADAPNTVLSILPHANKRDYWIMYAPDSITVYAYLFTDNGLNYTPIVSKGYFNRYKNQTTYCLGGSGDYDYQILNAPFIPTRDKKQLIVTGLIKSVHPTAAALIYDFDNNSGKLSNPVSIFNYKDVSDSGFSTQTAAISWNDTFIYFGVASYRDFAKPGINSYFYQINRFTKNKIRLASNYVPPPYLSGTGYWATTMAPDGKIYCKDYSQANGTLTKPASLWVVENPNLHGTKSRFKRWQYDTFSYNLLVWTFPTSLNRITPPYYTTNNTNNSCIDTVVFLIKLNSQYKKVIINFGDGDTAEMYGSLTGTVIFKHRYLSDGSFPASIRTWEASSNSARWYTSNITVYKPPTALSYTATHHPSCTGDSVQLRLRAGNASRFTANWGLLKSAGIYYDTIANGVKDSVTFRFFYPRSVARAPIVLSAQNTNCSVNKSDTLLLKPLPLPGAHLHLVQDTLCAGSALHVADST